MLRVVRAKKMAEDVEENALIHFVDEREFKQVSVVGKRKSRKNRALGFVLPAVGAESSSEDDDEVEVDSSSGIESADENNNENTEEGSCSFEELSEKEESETKPSEQAATSSRKPKVSSSKKTTQARKVQNSLTEDEFEEFCDKLEIKREELDGEIKKKLNSSSNLLFYPSRSALMAAVLADKVVLNEVTSEFVDDFIQIIHETFHSSLSTTDKKAALAHAWSKKLRPFLNNESWRKFITNIKSQSEVEITRADEIAILSCVHEGIYDFVHTVSHEIALKLPREPESSANGLQNEDRVILHRFGGAALCRMIKLRQNTIKGKKGTLKVTNRHKDELEKELEVLMAMKMTDKSSLPKEIKDHLDEGGLFFLKEEFINFVRVADNCTRRLTTDRIFQRSPSSFLQFVFTSVYGNSDIFSVFKSALDTVGIDSKSSATRKIYEQLLTKLCRTRVKVFLQAMKERDLQKKKKVADVDVSLRDNLKGFVVRAKRK